jgi:hypothetical protein
MLENPKFIQGVYTFEGAGLDRPVPFEPAATYTVPYDRRAQTIYFRAGNVTGELIYLLLTRGHMPMRYFPIGAKSSVHVPLAVVEDLSPETVVQVLLGAPAGLTGSVVLDIGFVEI